MSLDLLAHRVEWDAALDSLNRGKIFEELADGQAVWSETLGSEWQPSGHLWQYVGVALDRIRKESKRKLPPDLEVISPFVSEAATGRRVAPFLNERGFFVALSPEATKVEAGKFYNVDFRLLRVSYYDLAVDDEYPWDEIEQWGDFQEAFLPELNQWRDLFIGAARKKRGVLVWHG